MWDNVDNTIQIIESLIDLISKTTDLYDPQYCSKKMNIVHPNLLILLENLCQWKNHMILCMGLNPNVQPLMNDSLSWKVVFIQYGIISWRHFHHLVMNSYLHKKISPWQINIICIQWKRRISVVMIVYVLCPVVLYLMTSLWI